MRAWGGPWKACGIEACEAVGAICLTSSRPPQGGRWRRRRYRWTIIGPDHAPLPHRRIATAKVPSQIAGVPRHSRSPIENIDPAPVAAGGDTLANEAVPNEAVRSAVARAWGRTLDRQSLADDMPFDEAGGDSLRFLILVYHMEEQLGATLPLDLFDIGMRPSMIGGAIQSHLSGQEAASDEQPVLFLLPGIGGDETRLARLREDCADVMRMIPVDYFNWDDWTEPGFGLDRVVDGIVARIESSAPSGPLNLAGYSLGGMLMYLVAARLARAGRWIGVICILDSSNARVSGHQGVDGPRADGPAGAAPGTVAAPGGRAPVGKAGRPGQFRELLTGVQSGRGGETVALIVARRLSGPRWRWLLRRVTRLNLAWLPGEFAFFLRWHLREKLLSTHVSFRDAVLQPVPELAAVPMVVVRAEHADPVPDDLGWAGYANVVCVVPVEGDHFTMLNPPHAQVLAARFAAAVRPFLRPVVP